MGRLFWKFFGIVWLVQVATIVVTGVYLGFIGPGHHFRQSELREPPPLRPGEMPAPPPLRPDEMRAPPPLRPDEMRAPPPPMEAGERPHPPPGGPGGRGAHLFGLPMEPIAGGLIASLVSAALIAWYIAKPVRTLKSAIDAATAGNLQSRIADAIGDRRDELADLGRDFDRMIDRLQALVEGQQRLLHDVSHEMRSPLARLQAAIGLARQQPGQMNGAMDRIERESMRIDSLIGGLLTLARLQAGFVGSMDERIDVDELVMAIVDDASFEAEVKGRRVTLAPACGATVRGNAELLRRAIENVVRNAIKYTLEGATVEVTTGLSDRGRRARIIVSDRGPGVSPQDLGAIFDPFFRTPGATGHDGHGLGLAIARRALEAHAGSISASNRPEGGLSIQIELPLIA
jgi:signal transduction histidine kinase